MQVSSAPLYVPVDAMVQKTPSDSDMDDFVKAFPKRVRNALCSAYLVTEDSVRAAFVRDAGFSLTEQIPGFGPGALDKVASALGEVPFNAGEFGKPRFEAIKSKRIADAVALLERQGYTIARIGER
jgi:hypothetical protein